MILQHLADGWKNCERCGLHRFRNNVVYGYGECLRPDLLLIGEAPGEREDRTGFPFVGLSGKFLEETLEKAARLVGSAYPTLYITNTVGCIPRDSAQGSFRAPHRKEIELCRDRLVEIRRVIRPIAVVLVGRLAQGAYSDFFPEYEGRVFWVWHPAFILRSGGFQSRNFPLWLASWREVLETVDKIKRGTSHG